MSPPRRRREQSEGPTLTARLGDGHIAYRLLDNVDDLDPWLSDYAAGRYPMASRANALWSEKSKIVFLKNHPKTALAPCFTRFFREKLRGWSVALCIASLTGPPGTGS
jgi:hypothetical protein